ncbi:MAG: glycosyltransferase [Hyphomicrobiaceae bacterium]
MNLGSALPIIGRSPSDETAQAGRRAIVCSAQHWHAPVHLSAHHLAKFLARRGWKACFLSTPTSFLHKLRFPHDADVRQRFADWRQGGGWDANGGIFHYTPLAVVPPSRTPGLDLNWLFRNWPRLTWPAVVPFLAGEGFSQPDLMVVDSALMLPLWQALGRPRLVYRVTDRNRDYPNQPAGLRALEDELAAAADLVLYTGKTLGPYVASLGAKQQLYVGNGVDMAHFEATRAMPLEYARIPAPRAVYVGTIAEWFDVDLVAQAAHALPHVSFVVIGPGASRLTALAARTNVHVLGARPYAEIPAYLQHAAVGLIPFRREGQAAFVDNINPLKLYEYMAAGLPVVSTAFQQIADLGSPTTIACDPADFIAAVNARTAVRSDGLSERAFARRFDWTHQFEPLAAHLAI